MFSFRVVDTRPQGRLAAISDRLNRRHIVRMFAALPEIDTELEGEAPGPGFHLLLTVGSGQVFRAFFEAIDCTEQFVFECFHDPRSLPRIFRPFSMQPAQIACAGPAPDLRERSRTR